MSNTGVKPSRAQLMSVGPARNDHRVALRVGASLAVPLLVLLATHRLDWSAYAVFGAFASLYGRALPYARRTGMQLTAAAAMVAAVVLGAAVSLLPGAQWIAVAIGAVVSCAAAALAQVLDWHPPGPLFQMFGFATCAAVPATLGTLPIAAGLAAGSGLLAVLIGRLGALRPRSPQAGGVSWPKPVALQRRPLINFFIAPLLAGSIALMLGWGHSYWAMVAAVVPLAAPDTPARLARASHRLVGTLAGLLLAAGLLALHVGGLFAVLIVVALQIGAEMFVGRHYVLALVFVTPLALMMGELSRSSPAGPLLRDRLLETLLGVGVAVLLTLLPTVRPAVRPTGRPNQVVPLIGEAAAPGSSVSTGNSLPSTPNGRGSPVKR